MDRRNFFKDLGVATVGIVAAPAIAAEALKEPLGIVYHNGDVVSYIKNGVQYSFDDYENVLKFWRETGMLLYKPYKPSNGTLTKRVFDQYGVTFIKSKR